MNFAQLDFFFPFIVFGYGILLLSATEIPALMRLGKEKMPQFYSQFQARKSLAWICFYVGGLWSVQNLLSN